MTEVDAPGGRRLASSVTSSRGIGRDLLPRLLRTSLPAGLLASFLFISVVAPPARAADPGDERAAGPDPGLVQVQQTLSTGFQQLNADLLASAFSRRIKTYVACALLASDDGYYGADQMRLLLRRLFRGRESVRFKLLEPAAHARPDGQAVVPALWVYREPGAPATEVRLSFSLAPEAGTWRVREIRDLK